MIAVPLLTVTPAMLASDAVNEPAWSGSPTSYDKFDAVSKNNRRWVSLQDANSGNDPEAVASTWWVDDGPVNSLRMFDLSAATLTTWAGTGTLTITPGTTITTVGLQGLVGVTLMLIVRNGATVLAQYTANLQTSDGTEWGYAFGDVEQVADLVFTDLPVPSTAIDIIISGTATSIAVCALGAQKYLGPAQKGASISTELRGRDYTDAQGNPVATDRGYARTLSATITTDRTNFNRLGAWLERTVQQPMLWVVAPDVGDYDSAQLIGRYQRAVRVLDADGGKQITLALEVAGYK